MNELTPNYLPPDFVQTYENFYADVHYSKSQKTIVLRATETYIPIEYFKQIFESIEQTAKLDSVIKMIFDKRRLTTFHQPSMEWYFVDWKPRAKEFGISTYVKILPELDWFKQAVEAGKDKIPSNAGLLKNLISALQMFRFNQLDIWKHRYLKHSCHS